MRSNSSYRISDNGPVLAALLAGGLAIAGCTQFPDLDESFSPEARDARFPLLVPTDVLRADAPVQRIDDQTLPGLETRAAALRNRAARLRGTVLNQNARARLEQTPNLPKES